MIGRQSNVLCGTLYKKETVLGHITHEDRANSFQITIVVLHRRESEPMVDFQLKMIKLTAVAGILEKHPTLLRQQMKFAMEVN